MDLDRYNPIFRHEHDKQNCTRPYDPEHKSDGEKDFGNDAPPEQGLVSALHIVRIRYSRVIHILVVRLHVAPTSPGRRIHLTEVDSRCYQRQ